MSDHIYEEYADLDDLWRHVVDVHDWDLDASWNKITEGDCLVTLNELHYEAHSEMSKLVNG